MLALSGQPGAGADIMERDRPEVGGGHYGGDWTDHGTKRSRGPSERLVDSGTAG